jgi:hypothetical protein
MTEHSAMRAAAVPRRAFLRGVGVTMSLPWLESLAGRYGGRVLAQAPHAAPAFPKRFAVLFMGNGVNPDHWWAKGAGKDLQLGQAFEPLEAAEGQAQRHPGAV